MKDLVKNRYSESRYGTALRRKSEKSGKDSVAPLVSFVDDLPEVGSLVEGFDGAWQASLL